MSPTSVQIIQSIVIISDSIYLMGCCSLETQLQQLLIKLNILRWGGVHHLLDWNLYTDCTDSTLNQARVPLHHKLQFRVIGFGVWNQQNAEKFKRIMYQVVSLYAVHRTSLMCTMSLMCVVFYKTSSFKAFTKKCRNTDVQFTIYEISRFNFIVRCC